MSKATPGQGAERPRQGIDGRVQGVVEEIRARVRTEGLLSQGEEVVVMLSGGRDSVCLLDVAVALCGAEHVHALHVNYGLRLQAEQDEAHCRRLCERLGVGLRVVSAEGEQPQGNLHAWARELRYDAAHALARPLRARIATGHTATDQAETILYRLAASPGRRALLGMAPREGELVRPLLHVTRVQTADYCRGRGLSWREDDSNDDPRFARARVRGGLAQALAEVHPAAIANVVRTAELLREESELLEAMVDEALGGAQSVSLEQLRRLPGALRRMVVVRLAEQAAGTLVPQAGERVAEILALGERRGNGQLHIGGLVSALVEDGRLRMVKIASRMG
jgi:tRNA(Ile)-lysidine synthase